MSALVPALIHFVMGRMRGHGGGGGGYGGGGGRGGSGGRGGYGRSRSGRSDYGARAQKAEESAMDKAYSKAMDDGESDNNFFKTLSSAGDPESGVSYNDYSASFRSHLFK